MQTPAYARLAASALAASLLLFSQGAEPHRLWAQDLPVEEGGGAAYTRAVYLQSALQKLNPAVYAGKTMSGVDLGAALSLMKTLDFKSALGSSIAAKLASRLGSEAGPAPSEGDSGAEQEQRLLSAVAAVAADEQYAPVFQARARQLSNTASSSDAVVKLVEAETDDWARAGQDAIAVSAPQGASPMSSGGEGPDFQRTLAALLQQADTRSMLETERRSYMNMPALRGPRGRAITFEGQSYRILEELGHGGEGCVYHVVDEQGNEHVIKSYYSSPLVREGQEELQEWSRKGVPTIVDRGYRIDLPNKKVMYPYIHGLTAFDLFNATQLPASLHLAIGNAYHEWIREQRMKAPIRDKANNVVLDFTTGRFIFIDPG